MLHVLLQWLGRKSPQQVGWRRGRRLNLELLESRDLPAPLTWSSGINLPSARAGDAAVLETDNSILVLGGSRTVNQLAATGTAWTTANPLDVARTSAGVAAIGGGELLVYGGTANETIQNSALQYDPTNAGNIVAVAPMSTARTLLAFASDGLNRAYAIGGSTNGDTPIRLASVERFDPATGQWSAAAPLPLALSGAAAVYDGNGHILVFGGSTSSTVKATTNALRYTVVTNTWTYLALLPTATSEAAAVLGADGTIYVLGGLDNNGAAQATVQAYNPVTNTWTTDTDLPVALSDEAAITDSQGRIEILGGKNAQHNAVSSVYVTQSLGTGSVAPVIFQPANTTATIGAPFSDAINAFGLPAPTFSLTAAPAGMTINSSTGVISWTPTPDELGTQTVTVQATNASDTDSKTFTVTGVPDTTPPTVPQNLTLGTVTTTTASFSWLPSTDDVAVAGYRIFTYVPAYGGGHGGGYHPAVYTLVGTSTTTSGTATGLTPGASYNFVVAAVDTSGNQSGYSNIVTTTMLLAPSISYSLDGTYYTDPPVSVIANHPLLLSLYIPGNPVPTDSLVSAPTGVALTLPYIRWTPTAAQVGVNDIVVHAVNSVGSSTLDISVTVVADVPIPTLSVNGGLTYSLGNYVVDPTHPFTYSLALNPGFGVTGNHPQYGLAGTPFTFQLGATTATNPTTFALVSGPPSMAVDPNTGVGTWTPTVDQAGPTSVTVQETNSAGTSTLTFNFPTYFTTAPTNVAVNFYTSTSSTGSQPPDFTPVVSWTAPADSSRVADYVVTLTDAHTQVATNYDTHSTGTSFALTGVPTSQQFVTVTALDANGNPSITSGAGNLYILAQPAISWSFSTPNAVAGEPLSVQFHPASPYYSFAIASGPAGVTINPTTGLLNWTPALADVGNANMVVAATSGWGTTFVTLNFPVYFTDAPTAVSLVTSFDPVTGRTTYDLS
jgi:hypothetical protein